jgi:anaerobic carbon-monoxide dehydrogenase iron sulfur subunit
MPSGNRILVVENEPQVCRECGEMLSAMGWEVETASSGTDGLAKAATESFDAVVLDLELPDLAGLGLLLEIRENAPATPVIAVTRETSVATVVQVMKAGAFDCLGKPLSPPEVCHAADLALRARTAVLTASGRRVEGGTWSATGLGIRVNPNLCRACLGCTVACAYAKLELPEDAPLRPNLLFAARLSVELACGYSVPLLCMQCADAPCMMVCPTGALHRPDPAGPISALVAKCIGCRSCVLACPMGVLTLDGRNRVVQKCDLCIARTRRGRLPACVESCPTDALELVSLDQLRAEAAEASAREAASPLKPRERPWG